MEVTTLPGSLQKLLSGTLLPIAPDPVALGVFQATGHEDVRAEALGPIIGDDSGYQRYLFAQTFLAERMSEWLTENEGMPNRNQILLDRLLRLLGKIPVRNLVACAQLDRMLGDSAKGPGSGAAAGKPPGPGKEEGKITVTPSRVIPYALAAETLAQDKGWVNPQGAFNAGLHYDWLAAVLKKRSAPPDEKTALDAAFKEGLAVGRMANELGQRVGKIQHGKSLFAAGLLLPIGKALMTSLFPASLDERSWAKFVKFCDQAGDRVFDYYLYSEHRRFPITHAELSSLVVNFGALHRSVEKAIYFYPYPERLKKVDADLYQLSSALSVAVRMARYKEQMPPFEAFQQRWMTSNGIDNAKLKAASAAALKG
jgi:hypothetical protein